MINKFVALIALAMFCAAGSVKGASDLPSGVVSAMSRAEIEAGLKSHDHALFIKQGWIRDSFLMLGPDNLYYLTGTTPNPGDPREQGEPYNTGLGRESIVGSAVRVWRSKDLIDWEYFGEPFTLERDSDRKNPGKFVWAPELHWLGDRWALVHCPQGKANFAITAGSELKAFVQSLAARAERLRTGRVDPSEDNMLKITSEGRKAALDMRLMKPSAPDEPQGKVNLAVERIFEIWQESKPERSAQMVFCDLSTPKDRGFSVYNDMAQKLEKLGIPGSDIAFIQDYDSDASKLTLFHDVRAGKVRVLFGSTQKMGSGTNVQERLIALHHLDAPWRPADVEQREGRILRQGNKNAVIQIFRYVTEGSFDTYMWQTLETKAKFIAQVMSGDMTIRRLEDLDSAALTYAEVKAIASGNPLVIEKAQMDAELIKLTRLRSAYAEEQYRIRTNLRRSHEDAQAFTGRLANLRHAARQDTSGDKFSIELDGQTLDNRGIAGELIIRRAEKIKNRFGDDARIGRFAGFDLFLRPSFNDTVEMIVRGKNSYTARVSDTAQGTIRSLEANVQGFEERATKLEYDITDATKRAKELETKVGAHFEREERYQQLTRRQNEIGEKLDLTKNQASSQADANEPDTNEQKTSEKQTQTQSPRPKRRAAVRV